VDAPEARFFVAVGFRDGPVPVPHAVAGAALRQDELGEHVPLLGDHVEQFSLLVIGVLCAEPVVVHEQGEQVRVLVRVQGVEHGEGVAADIQQRKALRAEGIAQVELAVVPLFVVALVVVALEHQELHVVLDGVEVLPVGMPVGENVVRPVGEGVPAGIEPEIGDEGIRLLEHGEKEALGDVALADDGVPGEHRRPQFRLELLLGNAVVHVDEAVGAVAAGEGVHRVGVEPGARVEHGARAQELFPRDVRVLADAGEPGREFFPVVVVEIFCLFHGFRSFLRVFARFNPCRFPASIQR